MRYIIATAVTAAVSGFLTLTPVRAEPSHDLGGPVTAGKMCWASASSNDQGFWRDCPKPVRTMKKKK